MNNVLKNFNLNQKVFSCVIALIFIGCSNEEVSLFNGENLDGWKNYGTEKWYVENNEIVCESGPDAQYGYLGTEKHYKNFVLTIEFKQEANGNSGVFFRSTIEGTKISGWQVEVAQKRKTLEGDATGGIYESYGRGWLIKPSPEKEAVLKEGEWNHMKIVANGDNLTSYLNGVEMVSITDDIIGKGVGSIALQIHSGGGIKVKWRNLVIEEM